MRSSKSRSRSKQNNRPRTLGNIINRVFESSGPEGKVRGTPQQIIEKYQLLARDAQLSNDRVAAEAFLQHAEHYTRMLAEAQREMAAEQEARQQQYQQNGGQNGGQNGNPNGNPNGNQNANQNGGYQNNNRDRDRDGNRDVNRDGNRDTNRNWRDDRPADYGSSEQPDLVTDTPEPVQSDDRAPAQAYRHDDRAPVYDLRDEGQAQPETMLVETPESRVPRDSGRSDARAPSASKPKPPRDGGNRDSGKNEGANRSGGDKPQKPRAPKKPKEDAPTLAFDAPVAPAEGQE